MIQRHLLLLRVGSHPHALALRRSKTHYGHPNAAAALGTPAPRAGPQALAVASAIALVCAAAVTAQQPARDTTLETSGTATVSGTVFVDGPTKPPARRVRVTLTNVASTSPGQTTTTDDKGAFTFREVPAGRFEVQAFKSGYLRASYGASRPERAGTPVVVKDGEAVANIAMTIARGGVITGAVRDVRGRPVPGVNVQVLRLGYNAATGERTLSTRGSIANSGTTDDRGEYRAYDLAPGGYLVLATPGSPGRAGGPGLDDIRPLTTQEVQQALQAARGATNNIPLTPAPASPSSSQARVNYAPVFHPGVPDIGGAATITLGLSEERTGVDVMIQMVSTATVSGTIKTSSGVVPESLSVTLVPVGPPTELLGSAVFRGASIRSGPGGAYSFGGVAPGTYTIKASTVGGAPVPGMPALWARAEVRVNGQNLEMPLTVEPGVTIAGRVFFEGSRPTPEELQTLSFGLVAPGSVGTLRTGGGGRGVAPPTTTGAGRVDADGRFSISDVPPDAYQFVTQWPSPGASGKWTIKSSVANSRDAFDAPLRVNPGEPINWTVTYTDKPTHLTGVFQDRGGRMATDYFILIFPTDRTYWTPGSRRVQMTRPGTDGAFSAQGLPAGEYFLAALTDLEAGEWNDPTLLDQLVKSSIKVTLRDGETTRQDLRIGG